MQKALKIYLLLAFILIESKTQYQENSVKKKYILRNPNSITEIKIQFCQSWSYVGAFKQVKERLESVFEDVRVIPENYPLKNPRKAIYNLMIAIGTLLSIIILISDSIKPKKEIYIISDLLDVFIENKIEIISLILFMGFFIGMFIKNAGAFEIFCEDKLIWSTIENKGEMPNLLEIVKRIKGLNWLWNGKMALIIYFICEDIYWNSLLFNVGVYIWY